MNNEFCKNAVHFHYINNWHPFKIKTKQNKIKKNKNKWIQGAVKWF